MLLVFTFLVWFVIESLYFANPDMPFLKERQMLEFPFGIILAKNKESMERKLSNIPMLIFNPGVCCIALLVFGITQLSIVKALPYVLSNILSLGTCFIVAIIVPIIGYSLPMIFKSRTLNFAVMSSFEIYLIHAFSVSIVQQSVRSTIVFILVTICGALILHQILGLKHMCNK